MNKLICTECSDECRLVEETFGFAGTHCTNGNSGTHRTGVYLSHCCGAEAKPLDEFITDILEEVELLNTDKADLTAFVAKIATQQGPLADEARELLSNQQ